MPARWIDFKALKEQVSIRQVLDRYGFTSELREKGTTKLVGPCPIHHGKNPNSFHVNLAISAFNCFSACGGGNVIDLVAKIENVDVRSAAELITTWYSLKFERPSKRENSAKVSEKTDAKVELAKDSKPAASIRQESSPGVNPPLQRTLILDQNHPYLWDVRHLQVPTIKEFGLGYCSRPGIMRGRICIPIHDENGQLVAYAGRAIDEELAKKEGKYKLPRGLFRNAIVFNIFRAKPFADQGLICVESYFGVFALHQAGFKNAVAIMGSTLSEQQEALLRSTTDRLTLMFDGDEAGAKCLREFYAKLRRTMFLKEVHLEDGEQPDSLTQDRIRELLS